MMSTLEDRWKKLLEKKIRIAAFDIETDGLYSDVTKIHCMVVDDELLVGRKQVEAKLCEFMEDTDLLLCGHNVIKYDVPVLTKLFPWFHIDYSRLMDTFVWASLVFPDPDYRHMHMGFTMPPKKLLGSQSLAAWGYRLGEHKGDYSDWTKYTDEMGKYCLQDVVVTRKLLDMLIGSATSPAAISLEHKVAELAGLQERNGVMFDSDSADTLSITIDAERQDLLRELRVVVPDRTVVDKVFIPKRDNRRYGYKKGVPVTKYKTIEFNPNSTAQVIHLLKTKFDWEPQQFTDKGNPKLDKAVMDSVDYPIVKLICRYMMLSKRLSQISSGEKAWLKMCNTETGKIHGSINTCGAVTRRATHSSPNLGQVPSARIEFGKECRALFSPPEGMVLVGCDADQLELRTLAHYISYIDEGAYVNTVLSGSKETKDDVHWQHTKLFGLDDRDKGKRAYYAFIYGAGDYKLGLTVTGVFNKSKNIMLGRVLKRKLLANFPALAQLVSTLKSRVKHKEAVSDLDGQLFTIRSQHSALNELNQRAGAIIMKRAKVLLNDMLTVDMGLVEGGDFMYLLDVHDEWQLGVVPELGKVVGETMVKAIVNAGKYYHMACPMSASYKIGKDWSETH